MARRIVVGFDGSPDAAAALVWGARQAELHGGSLLVFAAIDKHLTTPVAEATAVDGSAALLDSLGTMVQEIVAHRPVEFRYGVGPAAQLLIETCHDDDILVVGSRGRNPLAGLLLGSVSLACLRLATCPAAVVRQHPEPVEPVGRVIVGLDASEPSCRALHIAAQEAQLRSAMLEAIHVVPWNQFGVEVVAPAMGQLVDWAKEMVKAELAGSGVTARVVVLNGHPSNVLVRHSKHADLLVLGSRAHSALAGLVLGSTAAFCTRHASGPVLVVP